MKPGILNKKPTQAAAVGALAVCLLASGAFAWSSFAQQRVNRFSEELQPGVNLHDDFAGGPEKDVYAENNGATAALVRLRLTEYLRFEKGGTYPALAADDAAGTGWHVHSALGNCGFEGHLYYGWRMGGHKAYMPAAPSARAQGSELAGDYTEPRDVGDLDAVIDWGAALRAAFEAEGNAVAQADLAEYLAGEEANAARLQAAIGALPEDYAQAGVKQYEGQPEAEQTRYLNEVRLTRVPQAVLPMADWLAGTPGVAQSEPGYRAPCAKGPFWVLDGDGWAYWAEPLQPGEATGLLLQSVTYRGNAPAALTYKVRAGLNAVSADAPSLNSFLTLAQTEGGVTENGAMLLLLTSGGYARGADGELYLDNGNNTFNKLLKTGGSYVNYTLGETLCAGPDGVPGNADDMGPGDTFALNSAGQMLPAGTGEADYTVKGIVTGSNGAGYLQLEGKELYLASGSAVAGQPGQFELAPLGQGERWLFHSAGVDGFLGTSDDSAQVGVWVQLGDRWYQAMGDNTWLLVAGAGSSAAVSAEGAELTDKAEYVYLCAGADRKLDTTGDNLPVTTGVDGGRYLPQAMPNPDGAVYYARAGENGLLGVAPDETRWPGPDGMIGTADDAARRWAEDFLPDSFTGKVGEKFSADGYNWTVLNVDPAGNRLILTDERIESMGARAAETTGYFPYASTGWPARAAAFTATLTNLEPYAMGVNLPQEEAYNLAAELRAALNGLSTCSGSKSGATAFVPSASDVNTYIYASPALRASSLYIGATYSTRSQVMNADGTVYNAVVHTKDTTFYSSSGTGLGTDVGDFVCYSARSHTLSDFPRMALWVRFGDAKGEVPLTIDGI